MKNVKRISRYLKPYWVKAATSMLCSILAVFFSLFTVYSAIPFLEILFDKEGVSQNVVEKHKTIPDDTIHAITLDVTIVQNTPDNVDSNSDDSDESVQPNSDSRKKDYGFSLDSFKRYLKVYVGKIIDRYDTRTALIYISILIVIMTFFKTGFIYLARFTMSPIKNGVVRDVRNRIYQKSLDLSLSYYSEEHKGDVIARMANDVQEIKLSIVSSLSMVIREPISIIIYLSALFYINAELTLFVLVLLPLSALILGRIGKTLKRTSFKAQNMMGVIMSIIEETLSGLRIVKAFNAESKMSERFLKQNNKYYRLSVRLLRKCDLANPLSEFFGTIVMITIMWYGANIVLSNQSNLSSGDFIAYLMLFYMIISPAKSLTTAFYTIQKGMASADRVDVILKAPVLIKEKTNANSIKQFNQSIEYKNVTFKYDEVQVLKNINLTIQKGKTVALVGQSGSGKSTMVDLLPRFYDINITGDIIIDGISIKDYKIKDLRGLMGIVNQESILFNDTIFNNIAFGVEDVTEEEIIQAAKIANAHEFIVQMPQGYQTNIGDMGGKLSGGQRQRISIARAVLKNPPILIFDEATSALDTESERVVQDALTKLMQNRTSIIIAHRLSTVRNVDEICVLHEGEIIERGKHEELVNKDGVYNKLLSMQMVK